MLGRLWLPLALAFGLLFAARTMLPVLEPNVVQADARAHVFWLGRLRDPSLFPGDPIADFYQSISPPGYVFIFQLTSPLLDPRLTSKLLPFALGAIIAIFTFLAVIRLAGAPQAAFLASVLTSWYVWQYGQIASGTPHALLLPWLTVQLWMLVSERPRGAAAAVVLSTLCYPVGGVLGLPLLFASSVGWRAWPPRLLGGRSHWLVLLTAAVLVALILGRNQLSGNDGFGPPLTLEHAEAMPEFARGGLFDILHRSAYSYWISSNRTGLDLRGTDPLLGGVPLLGEYAALALLLPALLLLRRRGWPVRALHLRTWILVELTGISLGLFLLAHLLLFRFYLPSRYVKYSLPLMLAVAGGLGLYLLVEGVATRFRPNRRTLIVSAAALAVAGLFVIRPGRYNGEPQRDARPAITAYLAALPNDSVIAAPPGLADSLPYFTQRPIVASRVHAEFPWAEGYYGLIRTRLFDLIDAYYAARPDQLTPFLDRYNVHTVLVDRRAFAPATVHQPWSSSSATKYEPYSSRVLARTRATTRFILLEAIPRCATSDDAVVAILPAACLHRET